MCEKILIFGTGKVANALTVILCSNGWEVEKISLRKIEEKNLFQKCTEASVFIYTVGNTQYVDDSNILEYFNDNCVFYEKFLKNIMAQYSEKQFIFFSSAQIYNIMDNGEELKEDRICSQNFRDMHEVNSICELLINNENLINHKEILDFGKKHRSKLYEYCKIISEKLTEKYMQNHVILRPTYLYGIEETENYVYQTIEKIFCGNDDFFLYNCGIDFVQYSYLEQVVEQIIINKYKGILNVSTGTKISSNVFENYLKDIYMLCDREYKTSEEYIVHENRNVQPTKICNLFNIPARNFEDGVKEIVYRLYIKIVKHLDIVEEYYGGSFARVYRVNENGKGESIVKIALGNGANNGATKLVNEIKHIVSLNKNKEISIFLPKIYDVIKYPNFAYINREMIRGIKFKELNIQDRGAFLRQYCIQICSVYSMRKIEIKENMLTKNIMRIYERLEMVKKMGGNPFFETIFDYKEIIINNKAFINPLIVLEDIRKNSHINFYNKLGLCVSGDAILDNAIFNKNNIYIMDQRGEDLLWVKNKPYFDPIYDLGKILFYFLGWKQIRSEKFELDFGDNGYKLKFINNQDVEMIRSCVEIFHQCKEILGDDSTDYEFYFKIYLMAGLHFLADSYPRLVGKGNKEKQCIAELLLGTQIINNLNSQKDVEELGERSIYVFNR